MILLQNNDNRVANCGKIIAKLKDVLIRTNLLKNVENFSMIKNLITKLIVILILLVLIMVFLIL